MGTYEGPIAIAGCDTAFYVREYIEEEEMKVTSMIAAGLKECGFGPDDALVAPAATGDAGE